VSRGGACEGDSRTDLLERRSPPRRSPPPSDLLERHAATRNGFMVPLIPRGPIYWVRRERGGSTAIRGHFSSRSEWETKNA
jgi:hypothetical protein